MKLSKTKMYNMDKIGNDIQLSTYELLEKAGYIKQISSGLFVQMHLMKLVMNNIERVIREELNKIGSMEIGLNQLQSAETWKQTGRYDNYGTEMFKLKDRSGKEMVFVGTNEELITTVAKNYVGSYKDLSFTFYQINNKFRDEIRCNTGLIRCKEFIMMDAYSFHTCKEDLQAYYEEMKKCYISIFDRLGLKYRIELADSGEIGGSVSEEFVVESKDGDIEVGHIFQLDDKYSSKLDAKYVDDKNEKQSIIMGCYGIGISRLAQVLADVNRVGNYMNWSLETSAYQYAIAVSDVTNYRQMEVANKIYSDLRLKGFSVYMDDRNIKMGKKLTEMDIIGTTRKILVGKNVEEGKYEMKEKNDNWKKYDIEI